MARLEGDLREQVGVVDGLERRSRRACCGDEGAAHRSDLGERAFEIGLARDKAEGKVETQWLTRHGSTPITGASKLAADHVAAGLAATGAIGAISLRPRNFVGSAAGPVERDTTRLIPKIIATLLDEVPALCVNGDGSAIRDYLHVEDMADAVCLAPSACRPGQWTPNVGSGRGASIRDLLVTVPR